MGGAALYPAVYGRAGARHSRPEHIPGSLHGLQIAVPRWSPDASKIAFIGGLMSDQGATGGDIYLLSAKGRAERLDPGRGQERGLDSLARRRPTSIIGLVEQVRSG